MSKKTNAFNLQKIHDVWDDLDKSFHESGYTNEREYLKAALGYSGESSGLTSLCTRLAKYAGDDQEEYEALFARFSAVETAINEHLSNSDFKGKCLQDISFGEFNDSVNEDEDDAYAETIFVDAEIFTKDSISIYDVINAGFLCDTFLASGDSIVHLSIPTDTEFISIRNSSDFSFWLSTLCTKASTGSMSNFEKVALYHLILILKSIKRRKVKELKDPVIIVGKKYFAKTDFGVAVGRCKTNKYSVKTDELESLKYTFSGKDFFVSKYRVHTSCLRDAINNKFVGIFVDC